MKEPFLLLSVQQCVRSVKIQNQPTRRLRMRRHELLKQHLVNRHRRLPADALLQSAQRRRTRQRLQPTSRRLQCRVVTQLPVIVQVLVPQGQSVHSLPEQIHQTVIATGLTA